MIEEVREWWRYWRPVFRGLGSKALMLIIFIAVIIVCWVLKLLNMIPFVDTYECPPLTNDDTEFY